MRERDFTRPRVQAAADQRRHAGGMVWSSKRPPIGQRAAFDFAGDGRDHRDFQKFGRRERWKNRRKPRRQHRFAGTRRPHHEEVVAAGRRDFERPLGAFLALDVGEIERHGFGFEDFGLLPRQHLRAFEMIGELNERGGGDDFDFRARPSGFRSAARRTDQAFAAGIGADRRRQHAGDRRDGAVEAKLAQNGKSRQRVVRDGSDRYHEPERNRQVVVAAFLRKVGRREVDGDAPSGQREPRSNQSGAHALAGF